MTSSALEVSMLLRMGMDVGCESEMSLLSIREAAAYVGLSAHTLRYYERAGLVLPVRRTDAGHRRYARADLDRLRFLACLRDTGMPIRLLRRYAELSRGGRASLVARVALLREHRSEVVARMEAMRASLSVIDAKVSWLEAAERRG